MLKYTPLRHQMLKTAAIGAVMRVTVSLDMTRTQWRVTTTSGRKTLKAAESRAVGELDQANLISATRKLGPSAFSPWQAVLTKAGHAVLTEWNEKHGDLKV